MLDAFETRQRSADVADLSGTPLQQNDLKAIVMVEMHMGRRYDEFVMIVLETGQVVLQLALVVIVDERQHAGGSHFRITDAFLDEPGSDKVSNGFRPSAVTRMADISVEFGDEVLFDGNAEPDECMACHGSTFFRNVTRRPDTCKRRGALCVSSAISVY